METNNKLREALMQIYGRVNSLDENCAVDPVEIRDIAKAALDEPVRNYEVGTVENQGRRFEAYCHGRMDSVMYCVHCPLFMRTPGGHCELTWAQMPYEGGAK